MFKLTKHVTYKYHADISELKATMPFLTEYLKLVKAIEESVINVEKIMKDKVDVGQLETFGVG